MRRSDEAAGYGDRAGKERRQDIPDPIARPTRGTLRRLLIETLLQANLCRWGRTRIYLLSVCPEGKGRSQGERRRQYHVVCTEECLIRLGSALALSLQTSDVTLQNDVNPLRCMIPQRWRFGTLVSVF
jgi:hypothetical protein